MKKYTILLVTVLTLIAGGFFFLFFRMGMNDERALVEFPAAYKQYDQAITDYAKAVLAVPPQSESATLDLQRKAEEALAVLDAKASVRISSLTRHDGDLMTTSQEISDLAGKELDTLKSYQNAVSSPGADLDQLANTLRNLTEKRNADFTRYLEMAGRKD